MFSDKDVGEDLYIYLFEKLQKHGTKYATKKFEFIGEGSSRIVYRVSPNTAVKIAKNVNGLEQNKVESHIYYNAPEHLKKILCPILWTAKNKSVMFVKYAEPLYKANENNYYKERGLETIASAKYKIVGLVDQTKEIEELHKLFCLQISDLCRASAWGNLNNQKIVIDYGYLTEDASTVIDINEYYMSMHELIRR